MPLGVRVDNYFPIGLRPCEIAVYPNSLVHIFCTITLITSPYLYNIGGKLVRNYWNRWSLFGEVMTSCSFGGQYCLTNTRDYYCYDNANRQVVILSFIAIPIFNPLLSAFLSPVMQFCLYIYMSLWLQQWTRKLSHLLWGKLSQQSAQQTLGVQYLNVTALISKYMLSIRYWHKCWPLYHF